MLNEINKDAAVRGFWFLVFWSSVLLALSVVGILFVALVILGPETEFREYLEFLVGAAIVLISVTCAVFALMVAKAAVDIQRAIWLTPPRPSEGSPGHDK